MSDRDTWLTPPDLLQQLGPFDLDPCTPLVMPWETAVKRYTPADDGLLQPWAGYVWMNPPFSNVRPWLEKLAEHDNGIALVPASTGCRYWQETIFPHAPAWLFVARRIKFLTVTGEPGKFASGIYVALVAFGEHAVKKLKYCSVPGHLDGPMVDYV
jgi:hypothetical protein